MSTVHAPSELRGRLVAAVAWHGDRWDEHSRADLTGWWRDPVLLRDLTLALADLFRGDGPTVVLGLQSRGVLLGALVAQELGVGLVEVRKHPAPAADSDEWVTETTPPDYRDRHLSLGYRRPLISASDRMVLVDDWVDTGGQALGTQRLVAASRASWLGLAVVVDALDNHRIRRELGVRSLLHGRDL